MIFEKNLLRTDVGFWFGVTFDFSIEKYTNDQTGKLFEIERYLVGEKATETKQVLKCAVKKDIFSCNSVCDFAK